MSLEATGTEIVNTLVLERQQDLRLALIVEGDEECQLLDAHIVPTAAKTVPSGSKSAVLEAAEQLAYVGIDWAIGVTDADFTPLGVGPSSTHVITSRQYDLVMDVVTRDALVLRRVAISHGGAGTVTTFEGRSTKSLLDVLLDIAHPIGILRFLVVNGVYDFSVRDFPTSGLVTAHEQGQHLQEIAKAAELRSGGTVPATIVLARLQTELATSKRRLLYVNSHDVLGVLGDFLRTHGGSRVSRSDLAASLRAATHCGIFSRLPVWRRLAAWAHGFGVVIWDC